MSLQAVSGAGTRENNAVVCEALRCLCSVPAQLPEPERDLGPAAVTFVNGNMARPGFGQDKMLFLRVVEGRKTKQNKKVWLNGKGESVQQEKKYKKGLRSKTEFRKSRA